MLKIPIVFSTIDDSFIYYLYTTMVSILENSKNTSFYEFHIFVPEDFSEISKQKLAKIQKAYKNCSVSFVNLHDSFKNVKMTTKHIAYPTYYRLLIADKLPEYNKCIYLDSDIIVEKDLSEFFNTDIEEYFVAGVRAAAYMMTKEAIKDNTSRLELNDVNNYINAGVLLLNLKKIREKNLTKTFIALLSKGFRDQDQDIINVACYGNILTLPFSYNMMTKYQNLLQQCITCKVYTEEEVKKAVEDPVIIHYADKIKPWQNPEIMFGDVWWKYARLTPYYENMLFNNLKTKQIDKEIIKNLVLYSKKNITYYRYLLSSKILFGNPKKKYKEKLNALKNKINYTKNYFNN